MSVQVFISYRRTGGDVTAKLICEALKNRGYAVFYDYDALKGGFFDQRIYAAIEECSDFVLVLPQGALDRCVDSDDWVRKEIRHAIELKKNIIPVMLDGFVFPKSLPDDIDAVRYCNGVRFMIDYFDAVIDNVVKRFVLSSGGGASDFSMGKLIVKRPVQFTGMVRNIRIFIDGTETGGISAGKEIFFPIPCGKHTIAFSVDRLKDSVDIEISAQHPEAVVEVKFGGPLVNKLEATVLK